MSVPSCLLFLGVVMSLQVGIHCQSSVYTGYATSDVSNLLLFNNWKHVLSRLDDYFLLLPFLYICISHIPI